VVVKKETNKI